MASTSAGHPPLASIIIRSVGRPSLADALDAVSRQTYPAIEVIVVDATVGTHPPVATRCGPFPIHVVAHAAARRTRPVAANAGLDAARGEYIGFLDDDDLIDPPHVAGLVAALEVQRQYAVAYSYAREVNQTGEVTDRRRTPYSRFLLFQDSYVLPCATMFRSGVRDRCRFDERFDVCEDWDFWLQASRLSDFLVVPLETAVYRSDLGESGMGHGINRDFGKFERYRSLIADKWRDEGARLSQSVMPMLDRIYAEAEDLYAQGDSVAAEQRARSVLAHYPYHLGALTLCGTLHALRGDFTAAVQHFQWTVDAAPEEAAAHFNLAQALERVGRGDEAQVHYRRTLALDPSHPYAAARIARVGHIPKPINT